MSTAPGTKVRRFSRVEVAEQQVRCYELRLTGMPLENIAAETGLSEGTVFNRINARIAARVQPKAEELVALELDYLYKLRAALEPQIQRGGPGLSKVVATALRVSESIRKLEGLDAPVKIDAQVTETTQADLKLSELIREAKAKQAVEEAAIRDRGTS